MIYLDHNATSPLLPEVLQAMQPWLGVPANPASPHRTGQAAAAAVERAREQVATLVGGVPEGVVFTSGATEANHLFVRGALAAAGGGARPELRWRAAPIEHPCVTAALAQWGAVGDPLPVRPNGTVDLDGLEADLVGLSLMAANHETGVIQPVAQARALTRALGAVLHVDATQAAGRIPLQLGEVDGVVLSGHKLGGPAGTGALVLRDGEPFAPLLSGGGQERGRRAGTVNTAGVVGLGHACAIAHRDLAHRTERWTALRDRLEAGLRDLGARVVGAAAPRVPNTTCAIFGDLRAESLVQALDLHGLCVSAGAACSSGSLQASPVLTAMGDPNPEGGLRVSLGPSSQPDDVEALLAALPQVLETARLAQSWES